MYTVFITYTKIPSTYINYTLDTNYNIKCIPINLARVMRVSMYYIHLNCTMTHK